MRRTILMTKIFLGTIGSAAVGIAPWSINTAHAQGTAIQTDPLAVPTESLSSNSGTSSSGTSERSTASNGSTTGTASGGSTSRSSQTGVQLPGEGLNTSTQAPSTTSAASSTAAARGSSLTICPSIPTTDGGSANITEIGGFSAGGC